MNNIITELEQLKEQDMFRQISSIEKKEGVYIYKDGCKLINLSSNDYLNISTDKDLVNEFVDKNINSDEFCFSSASARLLTGTSRIYNELERTLSNLFNKDSALIFNTGFQCNMGVISALVGKGDVIFCDKLNHASIIDGMRLSGAMFYRYKHLDYDNLEQLLNTHRHKYKRALIISESVFSMDGDSANIGKLVDLKTKYNSLLMIDEAHAFCAVDDECAGLSAGFDTDIVTATFGKALGSFGAFVVANKSIVEYITNKARSFIFSTSIPPVNIMWTNWLLTEKREYLDKKREKLAKLVINVHKFLVNNNINTVSNSQIIPVVLHDADKTINMAKKLEENGYFVLPIRPPSVPVGGSRLRLSLTADLEFDKIKKLFGLIHNEI